MTDEKFTFISDVHEKGVTARSAHNKRAHAGKGGTVRLPSDNLTPAEIRAKNGDLKHYDLDHKMSWEKFKGMPLDLQKEYFNKLRIYFHATQDQLSEVMGTSLTTLRKYCKDMGIGDGHRWNDQEWYKDKWWRFTKGEAISSICPDSVEEPIEEPAQPEEPAEDKKPMRKIPLYDMKDLPAVFGPGKGVPVQELPEMQLTDKGEALRQLRTQLKAAYMQIDERDEQIAQLEHELDILRGQMQVVWGFLGRDSNV